MFPITRTFKPNLQCAIFSCFLHSFIDNYVFYFVFFVSSGVRQLLSRATETITMHEEINRQETKARNRKQRVHCK